MLSMRDCFILVDSAGGGRKGSFSACAAERDGKEWNATQRNADAHARTLPHSHSHAHAITIAIAIAHAHVPTHTTSARFHARVRAHAHTQAQARHNQAHVTPWQVRLGLRHLWGFVCRGSGMNLTLPYVLCQISANTSKGRPRLLEVNGGPPRRHTNHVVT